MYAAFAVAKGEPASILTHDLKGSVHFVVEEGRYARYENRSLVFENGERKEVYRVWEGPWPVGAHGHEQALNRIRGYKRKKS